MAYVGGKTFIELFAYELQELVRGFRFRAIASLVIILMVTSTIIHTIRNREEIEEYRRANVTAAEELRGRTVADLAEVVHPAIRPPLKLAYLAEGGQSRTPYIYHHVLFPLSQPKDPVQHGGSERQSEVEAPAWLYLIRMVLSVAAFILGHDAICAARQRARFQLLLSYGARRWQILTAKFLALWVCLALPFVIGALLSLPIVVVYGSMPLTGVEILKIGLILLLGLWAAALFGLMALAVSAAYRETSHSLLVAALLWVTAVVVIPAVGGLLARLTLPLPPAREISERMRAIDLETEGQEGFGVWRSTAVAQLDDYFRERRSAEIENVRFQRKEEIRRNFVRLQFQQVDRARLFAALSPMYLVQDLGERLVGSGPYRDRLFMGQAWAFRETLAAHVRKLDLEDPESPHLPFFPFYLSKRPVQADDVPRFAFHESTVRDGLRSAGAQLLLLGFWTFFMASLAWWSWKRYDVGHR